MGLLRKIRILVGALAHRPLMPRPAKAEGPGSPELTGAKPASPPSGMPAAREVDGERVADLIAGRRAEAGDELRTPGTSSASREQEPGG